MLAFLAISNSPVEKRTRARLPLGRFTEITEERSSSTPVASEHSEAGCGLLPPILGLPVPPDPREKESDGHGTRATLSEGRPNADLILDDGCRPLFISRPPRDPDGRGR